MKTPIIVLAAVATFFSFIGCSKTDPIPGVTNAISYKYNGIDNAGPASFITTSKTYLGVSYTEVLITSITSPVISIAFGFTNNSLTSLVGVAGNPISAYDLAATTNFAKSGTTSASSGTLNITSYDGSTLNGTFSFIGSGFTVTGGQLTNAKKI